MTTPSSTFNVSDQSPVAVLALDREGAVVGGNEAGQQLAGLLAGGDVRRRLGAAMDSVRAGRRPDVRWEENLKTGARRLALHLVARREEGGHGVTGFLLSATDITALRAFSLALGEAGAAIGRAPDLTRSLQETAQQARRLLRCDAIAIDLPDGDTPAERRTIAYTSGFDDEPAVVARIAAHRSSSHGVVARGEGWLEIVVPLEGEEGSQGTILARVSADPTEEMAAVDALAVLGAHLAATADRSRRSRASERRSRLEAGGEMATAIGHSLRHALYGISSAAQLLRFRASEDPVLERNIGRLLKEADRVARLVDALLDFGRPLSLEPVAGDPDGSWDEVLASHRGQLESRSLVVNRVRAESPASCLIDPRRFAQSLGLLLEAAAERAPEASDLNLSSEVTPAGEWHCRLNSAGALSPVEITRYFDPLTTSGPSQGGVGLALSRRIVDALGGTLSVESDQERGTTLTIQLPAGR